MQSPDASVIFSVYSDAVLFPVAEDSGDKYAVASSVVSATVVGEGQGEKAENGQDGIKEVEIVDLKDPVIIMLQLHNEVSL